MEETLRRTSIGSLRAGDAVPTHGSRELGSQVNLEVDVLAKYMERLLLPLLGRDGAPATIAEAAALVAV